MIIHNCIKCNFNDWVPMADADKCPTMQKYQCPECKTWQWILHSRVNPQSLSFEAVKVNEQTKKVESINGKTVDEFFKDYY